VGLLGCGAVADFGHLPAIRETESLELVALYDPSLERAEELASRHGGQPFSDLGAFWGTGLDAVVIASPAWAHYENVLSAAEHRVHVLCEKPLAMDDAESEGMIAAMEGSGRLFAIGFVYRFSAIARQVKRWVSEGVIGQVRSIRMIYVWDLHGRYEPLKDGTWHESPRWRGRMVEGGPLFDCGVHFIDLARWWTGSEIVRGTASGAWVADYEAPDHVYGHFDHADGTHTMAEVSFTYGHTARDPAPLFSYDVIGTGGFIRYDRDGWKLEVHHGDGTWTGPSASEKDFPGMYAAFAEALRTGKPGDLALAKDGLVATRLARSVTERLIDERLRKEDL